MRPPLDGELVITSPYGWRIHPVLGTRKYHNGVDLRAPQGTPVHAVMSGYVHALDLVGTGAGGCWVRLVHGAAIGTTRLLWSTYCHLSRVDVARGDYVQEGHVIGLSGGTVGTHGAGRSTGPHLHWSMWEGPGDRTDIDPLPWLGAG